MAELVGTISLRYDEDELIECEDWNLVMNRRYEPVRVFD